MKPNELNGLNVNWLNALGDRIGSLVRHFLHYITSDGKHYKTSDGYYYKCRENVNP